MFHVIRPVASLTTVGYPSFQLEVYQVVVLPTNLYTPSYHTASQEDANYASEDKKAPDAIMTAVRENRVHMRKRPRFFFKAVRRASLTVVSRTGIACVQHT